MEVILSRESEDESEECLCCILVGDGWYVSKVRVRQPEKSFAVRSFNQFYRLDNQTDSIV